MNNPDKKNLLVALLGSVSAALLFAAACPPHGYAPAAWVVPGLLLVTARRVPRRFAFESGLLFGLLTTALVARWLPEAIAATLDMSALSASLVVYGIVGLTVGVPCGLMTAGYAWAAKRVRTYDLPIIGAVFWLCAEWARGQAFAWEMIGHTQFRELWLIQLADLGGVYAVSFVVALVSVSVAELFASAWRRDFSVASGVRRLAVAAAVLAMSSFYGSQSQDHYRVWGGEVVSASLASANGIVPAATANRQRPDLRVRRVSTVKDAGVNVGPLHCRDLLDRDLVHGIVRQGADVLISNCRVSWLGQPSTGATDQHLALSVLRAVESRRYMVRSTNHGSDLITATGETRVEPLADGKLRVARGATHYGQWGDYWIMSCFGLALIVIGRGRQD